MNKKVQQQLDLVRGYHSELAAIQAFNQATGTDYKLSQNYYPDKYRPSNDIPQNLVVLLLNNSLVSTYPKKHKYVEVQKIFDDQFSSMQEATRESAEKDVRKVRTITILVIVSILVIAGYYVISSLLSEKAKQDDINRSNTATEYNADGAFKITFPCSDIHRDDTLSSLSPADHTFITYTCIPAGEKLIVYRAEVSKFLTNKFGTAQELYDSCSDSKDEDTGHLVVKLSQAYRAVEGAGTWHDCTLLDSTTGETFEYTKRIIGNTVYSLSVVADKGSEQNLNAKAQQFFNSFQLQ